MGAVRADVKSIFGKAMALSSPGERAAYLQEACAGAPEVRAEVESLLQAHRDAGSFLGERGSVPTATTGEPVREGPGTVIGPYTLREQIGEGGMGLVFVAEQQQPVRRKVALKVIKPGMDTRQVVARFEAERQALALMDHPHIAHVLDGGATASGRPYFVMELVKGVPITQSCDDNRLPTRQRLELFVSVCQAVQHAHHKGIIHRDIKPSNVLVTSHDGTPVAKVIDFGVAKAIGQQLTDKTVYTQLAQLVGTPLYMSPEQAGQSGLDIDTRSDVYSLGVLLYELLTGTTPFDQERLRQVDCDELRRIIREEEPPKPSTRISTLGQAATTVCAQRRSDPRRLSQLFRGELDWVVMKCLEKDRNRRYESAHSLARDLERYLQDEPVQACPPSAAYRFRKFARRHRAALVMAAVLALALLLAVGSFAGSLGWVASDRAARQAALEQEAGRALDEVEANYKRNRLPEALAAVGQVEDWLAGGGGSEGLRQRVRQWRTDLELAARLDEIRLQRVAIKEDRQFDVATAERAYREALRPYGLDADVFDPVAGPRPSDPPLVPLANGSFGAPMRAAIVTAIQRVKASAIQDRLVAALEDWQLMRMVTNLPNANAPGFVAEQADPEPFRVRLYVAGNRKAVEDLAEDPDLLTQKPATLLLLAQKLGFNVPRKIEVLRKAQWRYPDDFWINLHLGLTLGVYGSDRSLARPGEAVGYLRVALALRPGSPAVYLYLGDALSREGNWPEAEAAYREAVHLQKDSAKARILLGTALERQKRLGDAEAEYHEAAGLRPEDPEPHLNLANLLQWVQERQDEAQSEYQEAVRLGPNGFSGRHDFGNFLARQGKLAEATAEYQAVIRIAPGWSIGHFSLGEVCARSSKWDEAAAAFAQGIQLAPNLPKARCQRALLLVQLGDKEGYRQACQELLERFGKVDKPEDAAAIALACSLAPDAVADLEPVQKLADQAVNGTEKDRRARYVWMIRGLVEYRAGRYAGALDWLERTPPAPIEDIWYVPGYALQAMAHYRLGQANEARAALAAGQAIIAKKMPAPDKDQSYGAYWDFWLVCRLLQGEAEALVKTD